MMPTPAMRRLLLPAAALLLAAAALPRALAAPPPPPPANCSKIDHGVCLHDAYPILKTFSCVDPGACCANCSAEPKCVSWNINTGMKSCFLRGSYKTNPGAECISGQVRPGPPPPPPPPAPPPPSAQCNATTAMLQGLLDAAAARGGGWARVPCGFHATLPLQLPSGVKLGSAHCAAPEAAEAANRSSLLTLGACDSANQDHIITVLPGVGQAISGVIFTHLNLTRPSQAITSQPGSKGFLLENCRFNNISVVDLCPPPKCQHTNGMQAYSAIGLSGCIGCVIRGNHVPQSGGDALNFNSGEYIVTENLVENTGDGCIVRPPPLPLPLPLPLPPS